MKNWKKSWALLFLASLTAYAPTAIAEGKDTAKVQATTSGDVKVSYYEEVKGVYWSSKYGITFEVGPHFNIWARELVTEENPYGELPSKNLRRSLLAKAERIVVIMEPGNSRRRMTLRFKKGRQLTEDEIQKWIDESLGRLYTSKRYGLPSRDSETQIRIDGVTATRADYEGGTGTSLVVTFRTAKGSYFFYARSEVYEDLEALIKTFKFVK